LHIKIVAEVPERPVHPRPCTARNHVVLRGAAKYTDQRRTDGVVVVIAVTVSDPWRQQPSPVVSVGNVRRCPRLVGGPSRAVHMPALSTGGHCDAIWLELGAESLLSACALRSLGCGCVFAIPPWSVTHQSDCGGGGADGACRALSGVFAVRRTIQRPVVLRRRLRALSAPRAPFLDVQHERTLHQPVDHWRRQRAGADRRAPAAQWQV